MGERILTLTSFSRDLDEPSAMTAGANVELLSLAMRSQAPLPAAIRLEQVPVRVRVRQAFTGPVRGRCGDFAFAGDGDAGPHERSAIA